VLTSFWYCVIVVLDSNYNCLKLLVFDVVSAAEFLVSFPVL